MSSINVFYFDSKGFSEAYGIGSYRRVLLPELSKFKKINLTNVRLSYRDKGGVHYETNQQDSYSILDITFSYKDLQAHLEEEYYTDRLRARIIVSIIARVTGISTGIVHLNTPTDYALALSAEEAGYKVIGTQHVPFTADNKVDYFSEENKRLLLEKERIYLNRLSGMICLCEQTKKKLSDIHPLLHSGLIFNGVRPVTRQSEIPKALARKQFGFQTNDVIFLFAGRLVRLKGVYELIEAFTKFSENKNNVKLIMAGGGDYDGALAKAQQAIGKVIFTGFLDKTKLKSLYEIADVGLLPSYSEQSSFSALEMMGNGIPLIVSDSAGFEVYQHGVDVIKAVGDETEIRDLNSVNIDSLLEAMELMYQKKSLRRDLSKRSLVLSREKFSATAMAESTKNFYEQINQL